MRTLHTGLHSSDVERSLAFYLAVGYEVLGHVPSTPLGSLTMLKLPEDEFATIELVHDADRAAVGPGGLSHIVIRVESMLDTLAGLNARGVHVDPPSSPDGSEGFLTAWTSDPDGYRIEFVQWPPGHPVGMTREDFPATE
jgi:lactoylglutathione lyase